MSSTSLIWVAAHPPCRPFNGTSIKSFGLIEGLSRMLPIHVIACVHQDVDLWSQRMESAWRGSLSYEFVRVNHGAPALVRAFLKREFWTEAAIDSDGIRSRIDRAASGNPNLIVVFDDIVFSKLMASTAREYTVVFSPHDHMSGLFDSEMRAAQGLKEKCAYWYRRLIARSYEDNYYHHALAVHFLRESDAEIIKGRNSRCSTFVTPNAGLLAPNAEYGVDAREIDLLIWGNCRSPLIRKGLEEFLNVAADSSDCWVSRRVVVLAGGFPASLRSKCGELRFEIQEWSADLELLLRSAKICLLPDTGGAGIKNRGLDCLSQGVALAALRSELGGLPTPLDYCLPLNSIAAAPGTILEALRSADFARLGAAGLQVFKRELRSEAVAAKFIAHVGSATKAVKKRG